MQKYTLYIYVDICIALVLYCRAHAMALCRGAYAAPSHSSSLRQRHRRIARHAHRAHAWLHVHRDTTTCIKSYILPEYTSVSVLLARGKDLLP